MFSDSYHRLPETDQSLPTQTDEGLMKEAKAQVDQLVKEINRLSQDAANSGLIDKEKYVIPPHLHDLQEADLPENQRGLVISEIAQFRERAAKREREKLRDVRESIPLATGIPSGPKPREWGKSQSSQQRSHDSPQPPGRSQTSQHGYNRPVGFVKAEAATGVDDSRQLAGKSSKTDEELEAERKECRRRDEEVSFRDVGACVRCGSENSTLYFSVNEDTNQESESVSKLLNARLHESEL
jgi:RNA-binding protein 25